MIFAPMVVNVLGFKVNAIDHLSNFSLGPLQQIDVFLSNKRNHGFGEDNGDLNLVSVPINFVIDTDLIDSNSNKNSLV